PQVALAALAAGALPEAAASATLGPAPQPGTEQHWTRARLQARLRQLGLDPAGFAIPSEIAITRQAEPVSRAAVAAAAATFLRRPVAIDAVHFNAPWSTALAPKILVVGTRRDLAHDQLDLFCRDANDPQLLPFTVTMAGAATLIPERALGASLATAKDAAAGPVLVAPGQMAAMQLDNPNLALSMQVQPLARGRAGDRIRVWSPATHTTLNAIVVGKNQVRRVASGFANGAQHGSER
ncbi:MAG: flagella basal body P-ring formation protein FlgA, partial [Terriglobales bacterium]